MQLSGKDLFKFRPDLFVDDSEAESADVYATREYDEGEASTDDNPLYDVADTSALEESLFEAVLDDEDFAAAAAMEDDEDEDEGEEDDEEGDEEEEEEEAVAGSSKS